MYKVKKILLQIKAMFEKKLSKGVTIDKSIKGFDYDTEKPVMIPKGAYDSLGGERGKFAITNQKTGEFYLISQKIYNQFFEKE